MLPYENLWVSRFYGQKAKDTRDVQKQMQRQAADVKIENEGRERQWERTKVRHVVTQEASEAKKRSQK